MSGTATRSSSTSGWASTLYLLPSLFLKQIDFEAFGVAAHTDNPTDPWLRAAGGGVFLRATMMQELPITLFYQVAARFDENLPPLHLFGLAFE